MILLRYRIVFRAIYMLSKLNIYAFTTYEKETSLYFNTYSEIPLLKLSFKVPHVSTSKPFHHVVL